MFYDGAYDFLWSADDEGNDATASDDATVSLVSNQPPHALLERIVDALAHPLQPGVGQQLDSVGLGDKPLQS